MSQALDAFAGFYNNYKKIDPTIYNCPHYPQVNIDFNESTN